ncbi:sigma-70 family RNA polymerase sigma factor [Candidatus Poribacteria bacterium]|nr:sigma-70 family RNA polymerase sigma factor [Candidatus Poribacteria bacterium]
MQLPRGPHNRGKCPFSIDPADVMSAKTSVDHCVSCVQGKSSYLKGYKEDFFQLAFMTIIEETPNYDPDHPSGASFTTFIKSRVCTRLWGERRKVLQHLPYPHEMHSLTDTDDSYNPLLISLMHEACAIENIADTVIRQLEVETLRRNLPHLMVKLSENERRVIELKFFEELSGVEIAVLLEISEGRVSQLVQKALAKLGKTYLCMLDKNIGTPYGER